MTLCAPRHDSESCRSPYETQLKKKRERIVGKTLLDVTQVIFFNPLIVYLNYDHYNLV